MLEPERTGDSWYHAPTMGILRCYSHTFKEPFDLRFHQPTSAWLCFATTLMLNAAYKLFCIMYLSMCCTSPCPRCDAWMRLRQPRWSLSPCLNRGCQEVTSEQLETLTLFTPLHFLLLRIECFGSGNTTTGPAWGNG